MLRLRIKIRAGATVEESSAHGYGEQANIIADSERASFGIGSDKELKQLVKEYYGKEPTDVYLKSPTPWEDLYKTYGWIQVQRVIQPVKCEIMDVNSNSTILSDATFHNQNSEATGTFSTKLARNVTDTISSTWSNNKKVSGSQMIKYDVSFLGTGGGGETTVGFEKDWGSSETVSKQTSVTTEHELKVDLKPGKSAIAELIASQGTMYVRITYKAYLNGDVAVNYKHPYKGHHFHGIDIADLLKGSNSVQIVEDVVLDYYSNATVRMRDAVTNEELMFYIAKNPDEAPYDDETHESLPADHPDQPLSE